MKKNNFVIGNSIYIFENNFFFKSSLIFDNFMSVEKQYKKSDQKHILFIFLYLQIIFVGISFFSETLIVIIHVCKVLKYCLVSTNKKVFLLKKESPLELYLDQCVTFQIYNFRV